MRSDTARRLQRPRRTCWGYIAPTVAGDETGIWITVEGAYNRASPSQARAFAAWLLRAAAWMEQSRAK